MDLQEYIRKLEQQNKELLEQIRTLTEQLEKQNRQIENLTEIIRQMQRDKYGASSEKTKKSEPLDGQLCIFNEVEAEFKEEVKEPAKITKGGNIRAKGRNRKEMILKDIPVEEIICDAPEEKLYCKRCGNRLKKIGNEFVREEIVYIPAQLKIRRYFRVAYECPQCKKGDDPFIAKTYAPSAVLPHSLASPSSIANVIYQKYVNAVPLYRQEKDWEDLGIDLSRTTMANWVIRCSQDYFKPIVEKLKEELLKRDIVHCDETPVQVLKEEGKKPQTKSYMWLYRTGDDGKEPIIIYDYKMSRSGENAANFLKDFKGYVHSDGYSGYNKLKGITRCGCWAHLRRKFVEAIPRTVIPGKPTNAETGRDYCDKLFAIERSYAELSPMDRHSRRNDPKGAERKLLDAFWSWIDGIVPMQGSALYRAVTYALNQKPYMENYMKDGRLSISNNAAENAIRPFTVGRKNWLFADTPAGADASAAIYSIVETAKASGLNVYSYFESLLKYMPDQRFRTDTSELEALLPWSKRTQEKCNKNA